MSYWNSKVVVVTGGSAGFGLALAKAFCSSGATVVIIGRNEERNLSAVQALASLPGKAHSKCVDMADSDGVKQAVTEISKEHGQIDGWVNNVGKSTRISLAESSAADFRESMEANFFTALNGSLSVLPHLIESSGHLINIGSLSAKTAWPLVGPYTTSKHALAGLTNQVRAEAPENVHVLLVCPGPIARPDTGNRYDEASENLPEDARKPGAGAPVKLLSPDELAARVLKACEKRHPELVIPFKSRILFGIQQLFPRLGNWILKRYKKK